MEWRKYGTNPELDKLVDSYVKRRVKVAEQGYGLDVLINDENYYVRAAVATHGYGIDILVNDEDWRTRREVAKQGYGLDVLVNDKNIGVRLEVAEQGYGLDKLINDESWSVRQAVAKQGYGLDKLINDEDESVRYFVACQGYGLNILINDEDVDVRVATTEYLEDNNYKSLEDWIKQNPDKVHNKDINLQLTADLKDFIYKIDDSSKLKIQSSYDNIDEFFIEAEQDILVICAVDTNEPIITIEKSISDKKLNFKFIVDITNEDGDNFSIKSTIKSKEQLITNLNKTIEALSLYPEFSKYADDLENCL